MASADCARRMNCALPAAILDRPLHQVNTPRTFHGLKRIWEFLDERGLYTDMEIGKHLNIHNITDTKLLAYLLDPDSARSQADNNDENCSRYLGEDYPYRHTDIYEYRSIEAFAEILAQDPLLIYRLAAELPSRRSEELFHVYRPLGLPLMVVRDNMRRVIAVAKASILKDDQNLDEPVGHGA